MAWIYVMVFGSMLLVTIVFGIIITVMLKKSDSIELVQGKLENSDCSIAKAIDYLQITNEWSK